MTELDPEVATSPSSRAQTAPALPPGSAGNTDPDLAALIAKHAGQVQTSFPSGSTGSMDPDIAALVAKHAGTVDAGGKSPTPVPLVGNKELNPTFDEAYKGLANKFKLGMGGISQSVAGWRLATTDASFDDARGMVETDDLIRAQQDDTEYAKHHAFLRFANMSVTPGDVAGGWVAQNLPSIGLATAAGVGFGAAAAAVGAPVIGPAMIGAGLTMGVMAAGNTVYDLMKRGVDKDQAKAAGLVSGIANSIIGTIGPKIALSTFGGAAEAAIADRAVQNGMLFAKSMGLQVGLADVQAAVDVGMKYITARTSASAKPYSNQEAMEDFTAAATQALVTMPEITSAMHLAGTAVGTMRQMHGVIEKQTREHLNQAEQKIAPAAETRQLSGSVEMNEADTVDSLRNELSKESERLDGVSTSDEKAHAQLRINHIEARLKHAEMSAQIDALDQNLERQLSEIESRKAAATAARDSANTNADNAQSEQDVDHWQQQAAISQEELRQHQKDAVLLRQQTAQHRAALQAELAQQRNVIEEHAEKLRAHTNSEPEERMKPAIQDTRTKQEIAREKLRHELRQEHREALDAVAKGGKELIKQKRKINTLQNEKKLGYRNFDEAKLVQATIKRDAISEELASAKEQEKTLRKQVSQVEDQHHKIELGRIKGLAEQTASPKESGIPNSRLQRGTDVQSFFNRIRNYVKDQQAAELKVSEYNQAVLKNAVTPELDMENDAAMFVRNLEDRSASELNHIYNDLKLAFEAGKTGRVAQMAAAAEKRYQLVSDFRQALQGNTLKGHKLELEIEKLRDEGKDIPPKLFDDLEKEKAKVSVESDVNPQGKPGTELKYVSPGALHFFGNYIGKWRYVLRNAWNQDELIQRIGVRDILTSIDKNVMDNGKMLMKHLTKITGRTAPEVNELIRLGAKKKIKIQVYTGGVESDGITLKTKWSEITVNQAIDKLAQLQDEHAAKALYEGNKFVEPIELTGERGTEGEIRDRLDEIDPAYANMADGYIAAYRELYPRLNAEYYAATGEQLPKNKYYSGSIRHVGKEAPGQQEFEATLTGRSNAKSGAASSPSAIKERTGDTSALVFEDVHQKFNRYNRQTEHYIGLREFSKEVLAPIMRDPEINRIIKRKHWGEALIKSMHEDMSDIVYGNSDKKNALNDFLNEHILKNTAIFMLASKPLMFLKHIASVGTAANYLPVPALIEGVAEFYSNPIKNSKGLIESKEYVTRHGAEDLSTAVSAKLPEEMKHPFFNAVDHFVMSPTIYGIKGPDLAILYAARKYYMRKGLSEVQALAKGGEVLHNTQVSAAVDLTSNLTRSSLGQLITRFQGQVTNLSTETFIAWDRWAAFPTAENFQQAAKTSMVAAYSMAVFEGTNAAYNVLMAPDEKHQVRALYDGFLAMFVSMFPVINYPLIKDVVTKPAITAVVDSLGGDFPIPEQSDMLASIGVSWVHAGVDYLHAINDNDWASEHVLQLLIDANNTVGWKVGSPLKSPLSFLHKLEQAAKGSE